MKENILQYQFQRLPTSFKESEYFFKDDHVESYNMTGNETIVLSPADY